MVCTSGSVQTVADRTQAAQAQVKKLQDMLQSSLGDQKKIFDGKVAESLKAAKINDPRVVGENQDIKTEYTHEFSLDKIANVIKSALKALQQAKKPDSKMPAMDDAALAAYSDLVNSVAEAAKSKSDSASSLSFSMSRLSPGIYSFLYATSVNISDSDTFGSEAVTSTCIFYRLIESIDDVKNEAKFGEALIDAENLLNMKTLQAALTDRLADGKIDIDVWTKLDAAYQAAVEKIQKRLDHDSFVAVSNTAAHVLLATNRRQVATHAITRLSTNPHFASVVSLTKSRLDTGFF